MSRGPSRERQMLIYLHYPLRASHLRYTALQLTAMMLQVKVSEAVRTIWLSLSTTSLQFHIHLLWLIQWSDVTLIRGLQVRTPWSRYVAFIFFVKKKKNVKAFFVHEFQNVSYLFQKLALHNLLTPLQWMGAIRVQTANKNITIMYK